MSDIRRSSNGLAWTDDSASWLLLEIPSSVFPLKWIVHRTVAQKNEHYSPCWLGNINSMI
jgi:hypothetical protein